MGLEGVVMEARRLWTVALIAFVLGVLFTWSVVPAGSRAGTGGVVVDVTPANQVSPREQAIYDFDRQTVTFVELDITGQHPHAGVIFKDSYANAPARR
jgi:hypothetical protein